MAAPTGFELRRRHFGAGRFRDSAPPTAIGGNELATKQESDQAAGYDYQEMRLSAQTTAALQALGRRHKLTLNTLAQGAWALLLSRYSGEADVVFGGVVSGRQVDLRGIESMVGLFINTLPVRVRIPAGVALTSWLQSIQAAQIEGAPIRTESLGAGPAVE